MASVVGERPELLERRPDRHVDDDQLVVEELDVGRIVALAGEPPAKAWARLGEGIDGRELLDEGRDLGRGHRREETADVELGELEGRRSFDGHPDTVPLSKPSRRTPVSPPNAIAGPTW